MIDENRVLFIIIGIKMYKLHARPIHVYIDHSIISIDNSEKKDISGYYLGPRENFLDIIIGASLSEPHTSRVNGGSVYM